MVDAPVDAKVLGGVVMGLVVALLYQRFYRTKLPDWAGFFGGRRLVPILSAFAGLRHRHRLRLHLAGPRHGAAQLRRVAGRLRAPSARASSASPTVR